MSRHRALNRRYEGALVYEVIVGRSTRDALGLREEPRPLSTASLVVRREGVELWRGRRLPVLAASWPTTSLTAVSAGTTKHAGRIVAALHVTLDRRMVAFRIIRSSRWSVLPMGSERARSAAQEIRIRAAAHSHAAAPRLPLLPKTPVTGRITRTEYRGQKAEIETFWERDEAVSACVVYLPLRDDRQRFGEHVLYAETTVTDDEDDYLAIVTEVFGMTWREWRA